MAGGRAALAVLLILRFGDRITELTDSNEP